jgi:hypothetical protein
LHGQEAVRCHVATGGTPRTLYLDLAALITQADRTQNSIVAHLDRCIARDVPASTSAIVHLEDPDSVALASRIKAHLVGCGRSEDAVPLISAADLVKNPGSHVLGMGVVLVVASVVVTGRSLLLVSRVLRRAHEDGSIMYFVLVARMSDEQRWRDTKSNLRYGRSRPGEHNLTVIDTIELPDDRDAEETTWDAEIRFWTRIIECSI